MIREIAQVVFILGNLIICGIAHERPRLFQQNNSLEAINQKIARDTLAISLALEKDDPAVLTMILESSFEPEKDVNLYLFTQNNSDAGYTMKINDATNLRNSGFQPSSMTKIIIHGWTDSGNNTWIKDMRKTYLEAYDYNIIVVDWFHGAMNEYLLAVRLTRQVGEYLSDFLEYLKSETNLSFQNVHIIGHSLGSHVAGFTGGGLMGKVGRITGLDPARPAFEAPVLKATEDRLDSGDGQFVDVIHTCAGTAGFIEAIGDVDFYPNGGSFIQPGCSLLASQNCSHQIAHQFFIESISGSAKFIALNCDNWYEYRAGNCKDRMTEIMGEHVSDSARGKYYLTTNDKPPFAKGHQTMD